MCPHEWREAAYIACMHKLCTDNCSALLINHSYIPLILCMYPQGSVVMILMMIHVSHCPSLIISTWCGPLVLSFQVSPSPLANQHSTYMYNLPCRNIIHNCTVIDSREKNIHGSDSSSYCSLLQTVVQCSNRIILHQIVVTKEYEFSYTCKACLVCT